MSNARIVNKTKNELVPFSTIKYGKIFQCCNDNKLETYMRVKVSFGEFYAVCFDHGSLCLFHEDTLVQPKNASLVIE